MDSFDIANTVDVSVTNVGSCEQNEVSQNSRKLSTGALTVWWTINDG